MIHVHGLTLVAGDWEMGSVWRSKAASCTCGPCVLAGQLLIVLLAFMLLQVEHPVTEGITDTNIPSIQLMVGMGIPLQRIGCVRSTFNKDPNVSLVCLRVHQSRSRTGLPIYVSLLTGCMHVSHSNAVMCVDT